MKKIFPKSDAELKEEAFSSKQIKTKYYAHS